MRLNDVQIMKRVAKEGMISPFIGTQIREEELVNGVRKVVSYGLSSAGYDIRLGRHFKVFAQNWEEPAFVDPKAGKRHFEDYEAECGYVLIPPNSFILGESLEVFKIPEDIVGTCVGKSTYARAGIIVNVTPLEPGWQGRLTLEISNTSPLSAKVYALEGIAQVLFEKIDHPKVTYADRKGKYQDQPGVTPPKL